MSSNFYFYLTFFPIEISWCKFLLHFIYLFLNLEYGLPSVSDFISVSQSVVLAVRYACIQIYMYAQHSSIYRNVHSDCASFPLHIRLAYCLLYSVDAKHNAPLVTDLTSTNSYEGSLCMRPQNKSAKSKQTRHVHTFRTENVAITNNMLLWHLDVLN